MSRHAALYIYRRTNPLGAALTFTSGVLALVTEIYVLATYRLLPVEYANSYMGIIYGIFASITLLLSSYLSYRYETALLGATAALLTSIAIVAIALSIGVVMPILCGSAFIGIVGALQTLVWRYRQP